MEFQVGSGNVLCSKFSEIGKIIEQIKDKSRVGVCLDTCKSKVTCRWGFLGLRISPQVTFSLRCVIYTPFNLFYFLLTFQGYDIRTKEGWEYVFIAIIFDLALD